MKICEHTLNVHAPKKQKFLRGNNSPFMNKELSKAIMERSRLRNKYLNDRREERRKQYNKQRNFCVGFLRKTKRDYYSNLKTNAICDNKKFWQTVKPLLSTKVKICDKIFFRKVTTLLMMIMRFQR